MWAQLVQRAVPEFVRGLSTPLALVAARASPQTCAPVLHCPEVHRCPDCVCQGIQRAPVSIECSYWVPFIHGCVVAIASVVAIAATVVGVVWRWKHSDEGSDEETVDTLVEARRQLAVVRSRHVEAR